MAYPADWPYIGYRADRRPTNLSRRTRRANYRNPKSGVIHAGSLRADTPYCPYCGKQIHVIGPGEKEKG